MTDADWIIPFRGYVILLTRDSRQEPDDPRNPSYRGLERAPSWTPEKDALGFNPIQISEFENDEEMIADFDAVVWLLDWYSQFEDPSSLEVVYAEPAGGDPPAPPRSCAFEWLGIDISTPRPFYSLLSVLPEAPPLASYVERLNENGLFNSIEDATEYLDAWFRSNGGTDPDIDREDLQLSDVYLLLDHLEAPFGPSSTSSVADSGAQTSPASC